MRSTSPPVDVYPASVEARAGHADTLSSMRWRPTERDPDALKKAAIAGSDPTSAPRESPAWVVIDVDVEGGIGRSL